MCFGTSMFIVCIQTSFDEEMLKRDGRRLSEIPNLSIITKFPDHSDDFSASGEVVEGNGLPALSAFKSSPLLDRRDKSDSFPSDSLFGEGKAKVPSEPDHDKGTKGDKSKGKDQEMEVLVETIETTLTLEEKKDEEDGRYDQLTDVIDPIVLKKLENKDKMATIGSIASHELFGSGQDPAIERRTEIEKSAQSKESSSESVGSGEMFGSGEKTKKHDSASKSDVTTTTPKSQAIPEYVGVLSPTQAATDNGCGQPFYGAPIPSPFYPFGYMGTFPPVSQGPDNTFLSPQTSQGNSQMPTHAQQYGNQPFLPWGYCPPGFPGWQLYPGYPPFAFTAPTGHTTTAMNPTPASNTVPVQNTTQVQNTVLSQSVLQDRITPSPNLTSRPKKSVTSSSSSKSSKKDRHSAQPEMRKPPACDMQSRTRTKSLDLDTKSEDGKFIVYTIIICLITDNAIITVCYEEDTSFSCHVY